MTVDALADDFYAAMLSAWREQGPGCIVRIRETDPVAYLRLVATVVSGEARSADVEQADCADLDAALIELLERAHDAQEDGGSPVVVESETLRGKSASSI